MRIIFLTEMGFEGKIPSQHNNMRTEFAWMHALNADHKHIRQYKDVKGYDHVLVIFPKGEVYLNAVGAKLTDKQNSVSDILNNNIVQELKSNNQNVHYVQEGPHWLWNDYEIIDQINFYNLLAQCDSIFAHNEYDKKYYEGLFPNKKVQTIPTLMIEDFASTLTPKVENKVIIGGNFARWYGGFESYLVARDFELPVYTQSSHAKRDREEDLITHLPRLLWNDWMQVLKDFKFAVHLMPTVAAGTFSLNCAYFGIPCIGNEKVDTQRICHPDLSVDVADVLKARELATKLKYDLDFYSHCSKVAIDNYKSHYTIDRWKSHMLKSLSYETE